MVDAAYDSLLNKVEWGTNSRTRRDIWRPKGFLREDGTLVAAPGSDVRILSRVLDEFGGFPMNWQRPPVLPAGWWYRPSKNAAPVSGSD
jgi:hypothetical protein